MNNNIAALYQDISSDLDKCETCLLEMKGKVEASNLSNENKEYFFKQLQEIFAHANIILDWLGNMGATNDKLPER